MTVETLAEGAREHGDLSARLADLADALGALRPHTVATHDGWTVIVNVEAKNPGLAWRTAAGALDEAISVVGMPPWPIVRVEVVRSDIAWRE